MAAGATAAGLGSQSSGSSGSFKAYVPVSLSDAITQSPDQAFDVIVQGEKKGTPSGLYKQILGDLDTASTAASVRPQFSSIDGLQANLTGKQIATLANKPFVTSIVPNETVKAQGYTTPQGWTSAVNVWPNWSSPVANAHSRGRRLGHPGIPARLRLRLSGARPGEPDEHRPELER
jgi:hypothetical protein